MSGGEETLVRLLCAAGGFTAIILLERVIPRRRPSVPPRMRRWGNLFLALLNMLSARLLFPAGVITITAAAQQLEWGLFNTWNLPAPLTLAAAVLLLDLVIYLQHLMFHAVPLFWRLHLVHHTDLDFDVTTGLRFHPLEILLSLVIKAAAISALGPPVAAVLLFEILLNATAMFNHGNIRLSPGLDRFLRLLVVTPDMHRVHHSVIIRETNSNFGFCFPWWDRLFGTYRSSPAAGHTGMVIGMAAHRDIRQLTPVRLLLLPLTGKSDYFSLRYVGKEPKHRRLP